MTAIATLAALVPRIAVEVEDGFFDIRIDGTVAYGGDLSALSDGDQAAIIAFAEIVKAVGAAAPLLGKLLVAATDALPFLEAPLAQSGEGRSAAILALRTALHGCNSLGASQPVPGEQSVRELIDAGKYPRDERGRARVTMRCGTMVTITATDAPEPKCIKGLLDGDQQETTWRADGQWYADDGPASVLDLMPPGWTTDGTASVERAAPSANSHNTAGVEYARLSQTKAGDILIADGGFTCMKAGPHVVESARDGSLFVNCQEGQHGLDGQCDDGDHIIGFTKVDQAEAAAADGKARVEEAITGRGQ